MGRQVKTVLTLSDTEALLESLQQQERFLILHSHSPGPAPRVVDSPHVVEAITEPDPWLFYFLVREADLGAVLTREVPTQGYWSIDDLRSPVIEFTRSFHEGRQIRAGRFWFESRYFGSVGEQVVKPDAFTGWADQVLKNVRRKLLKDGEFRLGDEAQDLIAAARLEIIL